MHALRTASSQSTLGPPSSWFLLRLVVGRTAGDEILVILGDSGIGLVEVVQRLLRLSGTDVALHRLADGLLYELYESFAPAGEVGVEVAGPQGFRIYKMGTEQAV